MSSDSSTPSEASASSSTSSSDTPPPSSPSELPAKSRVPINCTKAFDSVYFCYSPFHQAREYYVTGQLDDCRGRLKRFRMCVLSRFRPQSVSEQIYEEEEERQRVQYKPVWEMREEYLENVRREEARERQAEQTSEAEAEAEAKWWL